MEDRCIMCGEIIPEGRQVCWECENKVRGDEYNGFKRTDKYEKRNDIWNNRCRRISKQEKEKSKRVRRNKEAHIEEEE